MTDKDPQTQSEQQPDTAGQSQEADTKPQGELQQQLEEAQQKAEENWNQFLRARAELENSRRRAERDVEHAHKYALEKFAGELLGVKDSLELGAEASREANADINKVREGLDLTLKMLRQVLERFNIEELNPQGEKFDPARHEAMAAQESQDQEPNTVLHVVQKGYLLNDRLLRPAMVIVAKGSSGTSGGRIDEQA